MRGTPGAESTAEGPRRAAGHVRCEDGLDERTGRPELRVGLPGPVAAGPASEPRRCLVRVPRACTPRRTYGERRRAAGPAPGAGSRSRRRSRERPATSMPRGARSVPRGAGRRAHPESRVRLTFAPPRLFVAVEAFAPLPARLYEHGVACMTLDLARENPHARTPVSSRPPATPTPAAPGRRRGPAGGAGRRRSRGAVQQLLRDPRRVLRTEDARALAGVTRSLVIEVAESLMPDRRW